MAWCPNGNQLDQEIFDAMAEFLGQLLHNGDQLAKEFGVPMFCIKALHRLGNPVTMKELGEQMHCDRSFVTMIADTLEERGLAKREPNPVDRRIKNLVLTPGGLELKQRLEAALLAQMPWSKALDLNERASLLQSLRKMTDDGLAAPSLTGAAAAVSALTGAAGAVPSVTETAADVPSPPSRSERAGEVGERESAASRAAS